MQGKLIDMEKLSKANELMPAIGNMQVNARGDELGPGGTIVRKREQIVADYYENNPNAMPQYQAVQPEAKPRQEPKKKPQQSEEE